MHVYLSTVEKIVDLLLLVSELTDNYRSYTELSICPSLHPFIHGSWDRLLPTRNSYTGKMNICLLDFLFFLHICIKLILILDKDTLSKNKMEIFKMTIEFIPEKNIISTNHNACIF